MDKEYKDYLEGLKFKSYFNFRGLDSLFAYLAVFIILIFGFITILSIDKAVLFSFPIHVIIAYIINIFLFVLVIIIWRITITIDLEKIETNFSLVKETVVFLIQMIVVYFMPITCVTFGFAFMNYESKYDFHQLMQLIIFTFVLMCINILFLMPVNRNTYKWGNILSALILLVAYLFYYFTNNDFLHEMNKIAGFELFELYPYVLFISFLISLRIGLNYFTMLEEFGYWDRKERAKYLSQQKRDYENDRKTKNSIK